MSDALYIKWVWSKAETFLVDGKRFTSLTSALQSENVAASEVDHTFWGEQNIR